MPTVVATIANPIALVGGESIQYEVNCRLQGDAPGTVRRSFTQTVPANASGAEVQAAIESGVRAAVAAWQAQQAKQSAAQTAADALAGRSLTITV